MEQGRARKTLSGEQIKTYVMVVLLLIRLSIYRFDMTIKQSSKSTTLVSRPSRKISVSPARFRKLRAEANKTKQTIKDIAEGKFVAYEEFIKGE